jgi:hypothetical protein
VLYVVEDLVSINLCKPIIEYIQVINLKNVK